MSWTRSIALSGREPFPYPIAQTQKLWELTSPHQANDSLPENQPPTQPAGTQAFVQSWTNAAVPVPVPNAQQPNGFIP